jgi:hypothetical protein
VIESDVNRLVYLAGTDIFRDFPRSETDLGDLSTVVQSDLVEWHVVLSVEERSVEQLY